MKKQALFVMVIAALIIAACGGQATQPAAPQPVEQEVSAEIPAAPVVEEAPAAEVPAEPQPASADSMMPYEAVKGLFTLDLPATWAMEKDTATIDNTTVETATAPDGNAFVQVLTNRVNDSLTNVTKGQVTLDYMKRLYGEDLRVSTDVTLDDGREKLVWHSKMNDLSGTTYFDTGDDYLFYYTVAYKDRFEKDYKNILKEVENSFSS